MTQKKVSIHNTTHNASAIPIMQVEYCHYVISPGHKGTLSAINNFNVSVSSYYHVNISFISVSLNCKSEMIDAFSSSDLLHFKIIFFFTICTIWLNTLDC